MKSWWKKTAWPWLQKWWWKILVGLALVAAAFRRAGGAVVDPVIEADKRAAKEREVREQAEEDHKQRVQEGLEALDKAAEHERTQETAERVDDLTELRGDPDELTRRMLQAGRK